MYYAGCSVVHSVLWLVGDARLEPPLLLVTTLVATLQLGIGVSTVACDPENAGDDATLFCGSCGGTPLRSFRGIGSVAHGVLAGRVSRTTLVKEVESSRAR
jgi:hypothetical protein